MLQLSKVKGLFLCSNLVKMLQKNVLSPISKSQSVQTIDSLCVGQLKFAFVKQQFLFHSLFKLNMGFF